MVGPISRLCDLDLHTSSVTLDVSAMRVDLGDEHNKMSAGKDRCVDSVCFSQGSHTRISRAVLLTDVKIGTVPRGWNSR